MHMKNSLRPVAGISLLIILLTFNSLQVVAQMPFRDGNQISVLGWTDDTHYLMRTNDASGNSVILNVDIKTGKGVPATVTKAEREIFAESLPAGMSLGANDVISPLYNGVIILKDNDIFYLKKGENAAKRLTDDKDAEVNIKFSPDGNRIAYNRNKDLYVYDLISGKETRITNDASAKVYNGYASWVYMEEVFGRPRTNPYAAFWWSPDGNKIAYLRTDETDVPVFTLNRLDEADGIHGKLEVVPYPKAGDPNPKVKMGIADVASAKTVWVKTDYNVDQYIAWPFWTPDSKKMAIQVVNRDQNDLKFILADPNTGDFTQIYEESRRTWVEFREDVYVMKNGTGFILRSYRNDWENLYYYGWDGTLISQLTDFNFRVNSIDRVDEDAKVVYFSATGSESTDSHFFRVGLDGKNLLQITKSEGTHSVQASPKGSWFIDTWNSVASPGSIIAYDKKGKLVREIHRFELPANDPSKYARSELLKIKTADGLFDMPALITYPLNFDPSKKYPVIFRIYGGPDMKNVSNSWQGTSPSWDAMNGIITFKVDHRASGQFGKKGLDYMYRSLGKWEILDYADAVKWLREKPWVDASKMGMTGGSYGGYMTCLALTKGADYWTHGFANYSVTDYRLYDNIYTERFMDTPKDNPEGYRDGSALTFAKNLKGKLFMTHGDVDDNVHMQNSLYLISKLQEEGKSFQFMVYPDERHGWRGAKALHLRNAENEFWLENFFGK